MTDQVFESPDARVTLLFSVHPQESELCKGF